MELWGDEPNVYTIGILSPGGENIERMQLKMGEFRSVRFFPEDTLLEIRSFPGATIGGSQVIRMILKILFPVSGNYLSMDRKWRKAVRYLASNKQLFKRRNRLY